MDSLFGKAELSFGPCNIYWDTESGGENLNLGGVDQLTVSKSVTKLELREAQAGDRPADRAVTAQIYQVSCGLSRATVERLEQVVQGFEVQRDSDNDVIRLFLSDIVGQKDSSIWKQMTLIEIVDGIESTNPFEIWDFWRAAPMSESVELVYDAATQRYYGVMFECYRSPAHLDHNGRATYAASRAA